MKDSLNYQAVGVVAGVLDVERQTLKTTDDRVWSVSLQHRLRRSLETTEQQIRSNWIVYPRFRNVDDQRRLSLSLIKRVDDTEQLETRVRYFAIRGELLSLDKASGRLIVEIRRNVQRPKNVKDASQWRPSKLKLWASTRDDDDKIVVNHDLIADLRVGQMISTSCKLIGYRLILQSIETVAESAPKWVLESRKRHVSKRFKKPSRKS